MWTFERVLFDLEICGPSPQLIIYLPLIDHLFGGIIKPSELQVQVLPVLFENQVHLDLFDSDHDPWVIFTPKYSWRVQDLGTFQGFNFLAQDLGSVVEMAYWETGADDRVVLGMGTTQGF